MSAAHLVGQVRGRRLLDELLVPPLQGTIALPQVDDVAVAVAEQLHLDVPRPVDVLFEVDAAVLEGALGLLAGGLEPVFSDASSRATRMPRPPPPAAALMSTG